MESEITDAQRLAFGKMRSLWVVEGKQFIFYLREDQDPPRTLAEVPEYLAIRVTGSVIYGAKTYELTIGNMTWPSFTLKPLEDRLLGWALDEGYEIG